ncbi:MAG: 50S ribosomal protein L29 [Patescibacteria group bacterium]
MEYKELKSKKENELHKFLAQSRDKLRDLRFKDANKQLKDVREIRRLRETIARILTLLNINKTTSKQMTRQPEEK